jgi:hypothetical protein
MKTESSSLSGTVRLDNKIVNYGAVTFHSADGTKKKVVIAADGTYRVTDLPMGEVKIAVTTGAPPTPFAAPGGGNGEPIKFVKIDLPSRYNDPSKSDLSYVFKAGKQQFDIDLKSESEKKKP